MKLFLLISTMQWILSARSDLAMTAVNALQWSLYVASKDRHSPTRIGPVRGRLICSKSLVPHNALQVSSLDLFLYLNVKSYRFSAYGLFMSIRCDGPFTSNELLASQKRARAKVSSADGSEATCDPSTFS